MRNPGEEEECMVSAAIREKNSMSLNNNDFKFLALVTMEVHASKSGSRSNHTVSSFGERT